MAEFVWNTQQRNSGTWTSPSVAVADLDPGSDYHAEVVLEAADLADVTLQIGFTLEYTADASGVTGWLVLAAGIWRGGQPGRDGVVRPPTLDYSSSAPPPMARLRLVLDQPKRMRTGALVNRR